MRVRRARRQLWGSSPSWQLAFKVLMTSGPNKCQKLLVKFGCKSIQTRCFPNGKAVQGRAKFIQSHGSFQFFCFFLVFFVYIVEARMRANTQRMARGAWDKRGGSGKHKSVENRDIMRSVEGRGMGQGTQGIQDGYYRDFHEGKQGIWRRWTWRGLKSCQCRLYLRRPASVVWRWAFPTGKTHYFGWTWHCPARPCHWESTWFGWNYNWILQEVLALIGSRTH